jgi:threonine-phosphate decarboxylase
MTAALACLPGCTTFPASANYVLGRIEDDLPPVSVLRDHAIQTARVLIRDCSSFEGMSDRYFRLAVRKPEENARALNAVASWLGDPKRM